MKTGFLMIIILFTSLFHQVTAQDIPEPYKGTEYGEGATKNTSVATDQKLNKVVTVTIRDKEGNIRQVDTWTSAVDGTWTLESKGISIGGATICRDYYTIDKNRNVTRYETWYKGHRKEVYVRSANGDLKSTEDGEEFPFQEKLKTDIENGLKEMEGKTPPSIEPRQTACSRLPGGSCQATAQLFGAYSYLHSSTGNASESFPLGFQASFVYNVGLHIALGIDASLHTKKIEEESLSRLFILAVGKYRFGATSNCDRSVTPDLHLLVGLGTEKYGPSTASGFAFGGGAGLDIKLSGNLALRTQVDFIGVKFENADLNSNIRASAGMIINFPGKSSSARQR